MSKKLKIWIYDEEGNKKILRPGAKVVRGNFPEDVYKHYDKEVINGSKYEGEFKTRIGRILLIDNKDNIIIQYFSTKDPHNKNWEVTLSTNEIVEGRETYLVASKWDDLINQKSSHQDWNENDLDLIIQTAITNSSSKNVIVNQLELLISLKECYKLQQENIKLNIDQKMLLKENEKMLHIIDSQLIDGKIIKSDILSNEKQGR